MQPKKYEIFNYLVSTITDSIIKKTLMQKRFFLKKTTRDNNRADFDKFMILINS